MKVRRSQLKDTVTVSTYGGEGPYGPVLADELPGVLCNVDETRRLVRDANGDETVSEATLQLHPQTRTSAGATIDPLQVFTPESQVVIRGRVTRVITCKPHTIRGRTAMVEVTCA